MKILSTYTLLVLTAGSFAQDLSKLPANTFVELKHTVDQPSDPDERGRFARQGWNKLVYDSTGKRVLFYDRWVDQKHGGQTIYGNCLFAFDPASRRLTPVKIDNWTKKETKEGGYRTLARPENDTEPTPAPRHVYHAFEYVPTENAVYICNGANQSIIDKAGKLVAHDACDGTWKLDLKSKKWMRIESKESPRNRLDEAMAYCPATNSLVYAAADGQIWLMDLEQKQWRKAKQSPPARTAMGRTAFYDPSTRRVLLIGGGRLDAWMKGKAPEFYEVYAFDAKAEKVERLADAPTALYSSHLAYDSKRSLFFTVATFEKKEHPSGMYAYDPKKNTWKEIVPANAIPPLKGWMGWMQICYDDEHDCLIAKVNDRFFAFRYQEGK